MYNFDDSSDEEDTVEALDNNISTNWKNFSDDALEDLKHRTKLVNDEEKGNNKSLYSQLKAVKDNATLLEEANKILIEIDNSQILLINTEALANKKYIKLVVDEIKEYIQAQHKELSLKLKPIYEKYIEFIKKEALKFLFPELEKKEATDFSFKTRKKKLQNENDYNDLLKEAVKQITDWLNAEKEKLHYIFTKLKEIKNILPTIDSLIEISAPDIDHECKLSFIAHYIGTALLHHRSVTRIYTEDKRQYLTHPQITKNFQYTLLNQSLITKALIEFNKIYKDQTGIKFLPAEQFIDVLTDLQKGENLRALLKKANKINDYLLLRKMYDCIDRSKISFGSFIKKSNDEIVELIKEKYPIFNIETAQILIVEEFSDSNKTDIQIIPSQEYYRYGQFEGHINLELFNKIEDKRAFILAAKVYPPEVLVIYNICKKRKFNSAKEFYTQNTESDNNLIADTMQLITGLYDLRNAEMYVAEREPTPQELSKVHQNLIIWLNIINKTNCVYKIYISNIQHSDPIKNETFNNIIKEDPDDEQIDKNNKYLKETIIEEIEIIRQIDLSFKEAKSITSITRILLSNIEGQNLKYCKLGDDILQHVFMLVLRKEFYKLENLERVNLPETFKFTTTSPTHFLSNIRLANRSLTRLSRNLLQNPSTLIQINTISSGSAPLISVAKTWHFAANMTEPLSNNSFFAVDRQILNSKRSEKKQTLLSREHYVAEVGAYSDINETFSKEIYFKKDQNGEIANAILRPIHLAIPQIENPALAKLNSHFYFANLFYLLFGVEAMRNPAMLVINRMLLDLLHENCLHIDQLFSGNNIVEIKGKKYSYINGLMPTAPKSVTARSREINNLYHRYMPNHYTYAGDFSRNTSGTPTARDENTKQKMGINHLIYREAVVVTMWFRHKKNMDAKTENIETLAKEISESTKKWWKLES